MESGLGELVADMEEATSGEGEAVTGRAAAMAGGGGETATFGVEATTGGGEATTGGVEATTGRCLMELLLCLLLDEAEVGQLLSLVGEVSSYVPLRVLLLFILSTEYRIISYCLHPYHAYGRHSM